jgi:hypothetical protein
MFHYQNPNELNSRFPYDYVVVLPSSEIKVKMISSLLFFILGCTLQHNNDKKNNFNIDFSEPKISKLILVNAETNQDISELTNNYSFTQSNISIRAEGNAESITFEITGTESFKQTDNQKPFSLRGDNSGIYRKWKPKSGEYTLKVTPYGRKECKGAKGTTVTIKFTVTNNVSTQEQSAPSISSTPNTPTDQYTSDDYYINRSFENMKIGTVEGRLRFAEFLPDLKKISFYNLDLIEATGTGSRYEIIGDELRAPLPGTGDSHARVQWSINVDQNNPIYHTNYDMWLHPDISHLINYRSNNIDWYSIWEIWNATTPDGKENRWSIYIKKNPADGYKTLVLGLRSSYQGSDGKWYEEFPWQYTTNPLIFGQWFNFDVYWNKNTDQWKITINGKVVADFIGKNKNPAHPSYGIDWVNPIKHYVGRSVYDFMASSGKTMEIRYRNFKWIKK